jgi:CRP-like cAMP-binding protein
MDQASIFEGLGERLSENLLAGDQQDGLRSHATLLDYRRGQTVYSQGEEMRYVHLINSGVVRVFRSGVGSKRQIISFRGPGDLCGLPEAGSYVNSAESVSTARIYRLSWQLFHQMMLTTPHLQQILLRKVVADFHQAQSLIMILGQANIVHRVAAFLVNMMANAHFFDSQGSTLYLPMNRFDVADYLGTCAETTARAFTKLESMGIIRRVTPRRIEIIDAGRLRLMQRGPRRVDRKVEPRASLEPYVGTLTQKSALGGGARLRPS